MARLVVTAMPFAGHVRPMTAVAGALLDRGHTVVAYTGAKYTDAFGRLGCETVTWRAARDFDETRLADTFPGAGRPGLRGTLTNLQDVFLGTALGQLQDLLREHDRQPFDALVGDVMALGTGLASERLGLPWATISLVPLTMPSRDLPPPGLGLQPAKHAAGRLRDRLLRAIVPLANWSIEGTHRSVRAQAQLPQGRSFAEALYSPQLVIATGSPQLEWPRRDLPESVEFVGRLAPRSLELGRRPLWAETLVDEPRPVVFVTQGTFDIDPDDLLLPALEGLGHDPVRVIGTTAGARVADELPSNARLVDYVPFAAVVPHASVGVTNGGWGGVLELLAMGVPLVVAGGTLDKPEIAARVAWSGAGIDLRTGHPLPIRVRNAVRRILRDSQYRERAQAIAAEFAELGGEQRAAELIEQRLL